MKTCTKCKASKALAEFSKDNRMKDGLQHKCKACAKAYRDANKEHISATKAVWNATNKERIATNCEAWNRANKERKAIANAAWFKANPDKIAARKHRRRARKASNGVFVVSSNELKKIYSSPCLACSTNKNITLGHVVPLARGGGHRVGNFISQCLTCNQSQGSMLWAEWKYSSRPRAVEVFAA